MPTWKQRVSGPNAPVAILIATAVGAALFLGGAGALVYSYTQKQIDDANWAQHTQEVLNTLQRATTLAERIEYRARFYTLTGDEDQLVRARTALNTLQTTTEHLQTLVADNPAQAGSARELAGYDDALATSLRSITAKSPVPEVQIQQCQKVIGQMTDREQLLLGERNKEVQRESLVSTGGEVGFVALSLLTFAVLFGFLLRDARQRIRAGRKAALANEHLERTVGALKDRANESNLLTSARDELQLCVNVQQVYKSAAASISRLLTGTSGSICIINNSRQLVEVVATWGDTHVEEFSPPESCCGLRLGQARWRQPGASEIHCSHFSGAPPERYLCRPIAAHGNTLGMLYVECADDAMVLSVNERMDGLRQLVQITGMAVATLNLQATLEHQSIRDPLTGLFNRHFMQMSLERELARAQRRAQTLAVLMLDLDHFKQFNDTHGHSAGDTALKRIAALFQENVRAEDIVCRYGGEEFAIILPDTTVSGACARAESIRKAVENLQMLIGPHLCDRFSVSIGAAFSPADGETSEQLLRRADLALYRSKRQGRNQVSLYETIAAEREEAR